MKKIEYRSPAWSPGDTGIGNFGVLADEGAPAGTGDRVHGYQVALAKQPQDDDMADNISPFIQDLGNGRWRLRFSVERQHADDDAADEFLEAHAAALNQIANFDLKITTGETVTYMASCALVEFSFAPDPTRSTICHYVFLGGSYSESAPEEN